MIELRNSSVLIVDDSIDNIKILEIALKNMCRTFHLTTGKAVQAFLDENPVDLILLDILMPEMDGYEVIKILKAKNETKTIPVIFCTAMSDVKDETKGLELGAVDYIIKPFRRPIVRARVKNHLIMKKQRDMLENLSNRDGLTGIPNRRNFENYLEREWRRSARTGTPISLIMIDIDFFKKFNDQYGHIEGDDCLKKVAKALEKSPKRSTDFIARYGGEEFVAVLAETDAQSARNMAQIMQLNIEALKIAHAQSTVSSYVSISQGIATVNPFLGTSPIALIETADKALYQAKQEGRNTISIIDTYDSLRQPIHSA